MTTVERGSCPPDTNPNLEGCGKKEIERNYGGRSLKEERKEPGGRLSGTRGICVWMLRGTCGGHRVPLQIQHTRDPAHRGASEEPRRDKTMLLRRGGKEVRDGRWGKRVFFSPAEGSREGGRVTRASERRNVESRRRPTLHAKLEV